MTAPLAPPERRGALVAAIYVVTYLSFSVPTIIGGAAVTVVGLRSAAYGYGLVVMALAVVTTVAVSQRLRRVGGSADGRHHADQHNRAPLVHGADISHQGESADHAATAHINDHEDPTGEGRSL